MVHVINVEHPAAMQHGNSSANSLSDLFVNIDFYVYYLLHIIIILYGC